MKVKHSAISPPLVGGGAGLGGGGPGGAGDQTRFPKLEEYAHFHYDLVEIPSLSVREFVMLTVAAVVAVIVVVVLVVVYLWWCC